MSPLGSANHGVNTRVVLPRGFGVAAGFCVIQEGAAASALSVTLPEPVAKSLLDVGDVVMRRQDTSRTGVQVEKQSVGDLNMTQVFDSCDLLPRHPLRGASPSSV